MFKIKIMFKIKTQFLKPNLRRFSTNIQLDFVENQLVYSQIKFYVSLQGPRFWNKLLDQQQKSLDRETCFKKSIKLSLLSLENKIRFF